MKAVRTSVTSALAPFSPLRATGSAEVVQRAEPSELAILHLNR